MEVLFNSFANTMFVTNPRVVTTSMAPYTEQGYSENLNIKFVVWLFYLVLKPFTMWLSVRFFCTNNIRSKQLQLEYVLHIACAKKCV